MRFLLAAILLVSILTPGTARAPDETAPAEPDVRLVYESDTRGYYRPCG
jgi:hypothetical protein